MNIKVIKTDPRRNKQAHLTSISIHFYMHLFDVVKKLNKREM